MTEQPTDLLEGIEGEVKWFDARKGYGFIIGPQGQDVMVHYSVIKGAGYRSLRDGSTVEYDAKKTDKGWKATRVERTGVVETRPDPDSVKRSPRR
ncbi:MAG: cold shock domain-containing protein [Phycisphaerales bacterium]|jgi:CspA family cold shock protein